MIEEQIPRKKIAETGLKMKRKVKRQCFYKTICRTRLCSRVV